MFTECSFLSLTVQEWTQTLSFWDGGWGGGSGLYFSFVLAEPVFCQWISIDYLPFSIYVVIDPLCSSDSKTEF